MGNSGNNNNSPALILGEEQRASSPDILPSNVIQEPRKKTKKQKTKQHNKMLAQLTPSECALDQSSQDESPEKVIQSPEKQTPKDTSKGKRRASNSQNINPKSRGTPKEPPHPFKSYEEYASKREAGDHICF